MKIIRFSGQFAKLCFIAVLSCLFALSPGSSARASSGFHVSGRFLLDANGNNFIMRGINIPLNWWRDETISSFPDVKATGANTVRVVLSDGQLGSGLRIAPAMLPMPSTCAKSISWCVSLKCMIRLST